MSCKKHTWCNCREMIGLLEHFAFSPQNVQNCSILKYVLFFCMLKVINCKAMDFNDNYSDRNAITYYRQTNYPVQLWTTIYVQTYYLNMDHLQVFCLFFKHTYRILKYYLLFTLISRGDSTLY